MKKKIAILGSTGSIGKTTFNIIKKNSKDFNVVLLTTNKNVQEICKQAKILKVKNLIVTSKTHYEKVKKKINKKNIKIYNNLNVINKIFKKKIDYTMSAITGIAGLRPTLDAIKFSKVIAIANKESIICAWDIIQKELKRNKTNFIPVDSEHFSIWSLIKEEKNSIEKIYLTASGGPFLKKNFYSVKFARPKDALNHPKWSMGKKISIDSATMMNKVFEVLEAKKIFNIDYSKIKIIIHPDSYIHAIVKFNNGLIKLCAHETDMSIPIFNSIYHDKNINYPTKKINFNLLNRLNMQKPILSKFPSLKILNNLPLYNSLYETVLVTANDILVDLYLKNKIDYLSIVRILKKVTNIKKFKTLKKKKVKNINQILDLSKEVRLIINKQSIQCS